MLHVIEIWFNLACVIPKLWVVSGTHQAEYSNHDVLHFQKLRIYFLIQCILKNNKTVKPTTVHTDMVPYPGDFFESFLLAGFAFCIQRSSHGLQLYYFLFKKKKKKGNIKSYIELKQYMKTSYSAKLQKLFVTSWLVSSISLKTIYTSIG